MHFLDYGEIIYRTFTPPKPSMPHIIVFCLAWLGGPPWAKDVTPTYSYPIYNIE